ncbi:MAG: DUF3306 domain-containing protein [Xanthobacteraceae bacterium]
MSEPENFLSRWSRRKQKAEGTAVEPTDSARENLPPAQADESASLAASADDKPKPEIDLSSLPPIESIGVGTDIRSFLQKGVPLELTRAALRRAWTSDPTIRGFIGIAENQWDFATGSDIPGFGPLEASDDVRRMVAELLHENVRAPTVPTTVESQPAPDKRNLEPEIENAALPQVTRVEPRADNQPEVGVRADRQEDNQEHDIASQQDQQPDNAPAKRSHGRALPQ